MTGHIVPPSAVCSQGARSSSLRRSANDTWVREDQTEDGAVAVGPPAHGCPVEAPVGGLHQRGDGVPAVSAVVLRTKGVQRGQGVRSRDSEYCAAAIFVITALIKVAPGPAVFGCP